MQLGIGHELVFDIFHPLHERGGVTLTQSNQVNLFGLQVELRLPKLLAGLLFLVFLGRSSTNDVVLLIENFESALWLVTDKHWMVCGSSDLGDVHACFCLEVL
jgi:hypothetical protein